MLAEVMQRVEYPGLALVHLHTPKSRGTRCHANSNSDALLGEGSRAAECSSCKRECTRPYVLTGCTRGAAGPETSPGCWTAKPEHPGCVLS
jgi:hypothetical protein